MIANLAVVLALGILGIWKSVPVGFLLNVDPLLTCLMTMLGASIGAFFIYFLGNKARKYFKWLQRDNGNSRKQQKLNRIFNRYGIPGLGMMATLFFGPMFTMTVGMTMVRNARSLLIWTHVGIVLWSILLTSIGHVGTTIF